MKPNTYTKLYAHCVFTPKGRQALLINPIRERVHKYIYGIIKENKCNPIAINGTEDHIHILLGFHQDLSIADFMRDIKRSSSLFINSNKLLPVKFSWQEGYSAFTVGYKELDKVYQYVLNQQKHHAELNFRKEYINLLTEEGIDINPEYLFEFYE